MMQKLLLSLLWLLLSTTTLFGAYDVKIGVYKNAKNLKANIAKIKPAKYRNYIHIKKKNNLNYVHAVIEGNKEARNALHAYKRVFEDAFISKKQVKLKKVPKKAPKKAPQKVAQKAPSPSPEEKPMKEKPVDEVKHEAPKEQVLAKDLLLNKKVYLCYEKQTAGTQKRIVQMHFKQENVAYLPLGSKNKPLNFPYTFVKDTIALPVSNMLVTHKILKKEKNYVSGMSYINGKEAHALRYYFDKEAAEAFVADRSPK